MGGTYVWQFLPGPSSSVTSASGGTGQLSAMRPPLPFPFAPHTGGLGVVLKSRGGSLCIRPWWRGVPVGTAFLWTPGAVDGLQEGQ